MLLSKLEHAFQLPHLTHYYFPCLYDCRNSRIQWHLANKNDFAIQWTIGQLRTVALNLYGKTGGSKEPGFHERIGVEFQANQQG